MKTIWHEVKALDDNNKFINGDYVRLFDNIWDLLAFLSTDDFICYAVLPSSVFGWEMFQYFKFPLLLWSKLFKRWVSVEYIFGCWCFYDQKQCIWNEWTLLSKVHHFVDLGDLYELARSTAIKFLKQQIQLC